MAIRFFLVISLLTVTSCHRVASLVTSDPETVYAVQGDLTIREVPIVEGDSVLGLADAATRIIELRRGMSPTQRHAVLTHERCHIALVDFNIVLPDTTGVLEEQVCDAMGAALR